MNVKLLNFTPNPDETCTGAALVSFWSKNPSEYFDNINKNDVKRLKEVIGYGHVSVVEHASFTFSIEGISRACSHQLVRHRIASYTQQSQRRVKIEDFDPVIPSSIKLNEEALGIFKKSMKDLYNTYQRLIHIDIPLEDARYVLPNATKTTIIVTMNARELLHFFRLRCCNKAQWEIKKVAWKMLRLCKEKASVIFENAGPSCITIGRCLEGDLSCGFWKKLQGKTPEEKQKLIKEGFP